jgi:hypothetical protein
MSTPQFATMRDALESLGQTKDEVVASLVGMGIKGTGTSCDCPLARFLRRSGFPAARVGVATAWEQDQPIGGRSVRLPNPCLAVRIAFDDYRLPQLVDVA